MSDGRVLIVDVYNMFVRAYVCFPQMSTNGHHMGGCIGFLKMLNKLVNETQPKGVYLAWEGGGSQRRRALFSEYKMNRRPVKLNRFYEDDLPDTEENKKYQLLTLLNMIKSVPACQLYVPDCEADDVIAYLCKFPLANETKIIASSDKDMYQLLDDKTIAYSFHKKTFVTQENVLEEFRVTSQNFGIAKSLCGDVSDNIPGVKGLGFKTVSKLYPFLGTSQNVLLQDVLDYAASHVDESRIHKRVIEHEAEIRRNWKLVYLDGGMIPPVHAQRLNNQVATFVPKSNRIGLIKHLVREGVGDFDVAGFFNAFSCVDGLVHVTQENNDND